MEENNVSKSRKECYGNFMITNICEGHYDCNESSSCMSKTNIEKGPCNCQYKASCHLVRQNLQEKFRKQQSSYTIEDCDFYKLLKPQYEKYYKKHKREK